MIDKKPILERIRQSVLLPPNWDGFGTQPVCKEVGIICEQLVEAVPQYRFYSMTFVPSVDVVGGAEIVLCRYDSKPSKREIIFLLAPRIPVEWEEIMDGNPIATGSFWYQEEVLLALISG